MGRDFVQQFWHFAVFCDTSRCTQKLLFCEYDLFMYVIPQIHKFIHPTVWVMLEIQFIVEIIMFYKKVKSLTCSLLQDIWAVCIAHAIVTLTA